MTTPQQWFFNTGKQVLGAFVLAFSGVEIATGINVMSLGTLKAAAAAGIAAGLKTLDALVGNAVNQGSASTAHAVSTVRARKKATKAGPAPLSGEPVTALP